MSEHEPRYVSRVGSTDGGRARCWWETSLSMQSWEMEGWLVRKSQSSSKRTSTDEKVWSHGKVQWRKMMLEGPGEARRETRLMVRTSTLASIVHNTEKMGSLELGGG